MSSHVDWKVNLRVKGALDANQGARVGEEDLEGVITDKVFSGRQGNLCLGKMYLALREFAENWEDPHGVEHSLAVRKMSLFDMMGQTYPGRVRCAVITSRVQADLKVLQAQIRTRWPCTLSPPRFI
jgi:hypothetical protein